MEPAAGLGALATRAGAATFGNPDEPAQGNVNTQGNPHSAVDPGSQNPALAGQFPRRSQDEDVDSIGLQTASS
jgi:oxalate decarboxylase